MLEIRRAKSMVLDPADPNRRSCGSFFVNPVLAAAEAARVETLAGADAGMPRWPEPDGRVKLSAAWLIERAGFRRGERVGRWGSPRAIPSPSSATKARAPATWRTSRAAFATAWPRASGSVSLPSRCSGDR